MLNAELNENNFDEIRHFITSIIADDPSAACVAEPRLVERLRTYERAGLKSDAGRQTMQVIMSARRLIGDRLPISADGLVGNRQPHDMTPKLYR